MKRMNPIVNSSGLSDIPPAQATNYNDVARKDDFGYLCIPKMDISIKREYIFKKICDLRIGYIYKIIEIPLKNNANYKRILFKIRWNQFPATSKIRDRLHNGFPIYFVYDMPWFWKIVLQHV